MANEQKLAQLRDAIAPNDTYFVSSDAPEAIRRAIFDAGTGDTWCRDVAIDVIGEIADEDIDPYDDDAPFAFAERSTEIYNDALRSWFADDGGHDWLQQMIDDYGRDSIADDIHVTLIGANHYAHERIAQDVCFAIREYWDSLDD